MLKRFIIPVCLVFLVGVGYMRANPENRAQVDQYHQKVAGLIDSIPIDVNGWSGAQVPVPASATSLLRPNALVARQYVHAERGIQATLMIVQCRDARDMAGHYPPQCYPANGWLLLEDSAEDTVRVSGHEMRRYAFHRVAGRVERDIFVYNIFALPTGELTVSMSDVRKQSADYQYRSLGAAQIQVVIDGGVDMSDHDWILDEMYAIIAPAIEGVRDSGFGAGSDEGSSTR